MKFNILFSGVPKNLFKASNSQSDGQLFVDLISQIGSMSFDTNSLHWRYNAFILIVKDILLNLWELHYHYDPTNSLQLCCYYTYRYNLMANRVFLLVVMASRNNPRFSTQILSETVGEWALVNLFPVVYEWIETTTTTMSVPWTLQYEVVAWNKTNQLTKIIQLFWVLI